MLSIRSKSDSKDSNSRSIVRENLPRIYSLSRELLKREFGQWPLPSRRIVTPALTTAVLLGVTDGLRASIRGIRPPQSLQWPPLWRVKRSQCCEVSSGPSLGERSPVICLAELVVLPGVNEFVPDGRTELLPAVVFVGRPGQRNRDCLCCGSYFVTPACRWARCEISQSIVSTGRSGNAM